jgi:hypothetical protein
VVVVVVVVGAAVVGGAVVVVGAAVVGGAVVVVVVVAGGEVVVVVVVAGGEVVVVVVGAAVVVVVGGGGGAVVVVVVSGVARGVAAGCTNDGAASISSCSIAGLRLAAKPAANTRADSVSGSTPEDSAPGSSGGLSVETEANPSAAISITMINPAAEIWLRGRTRGNSAVNRGRRPGGATHATQEARTAEAATASLLLAINGKISMAVESGL